MFFCLVLFLATLFHGREGAFSSKPLSAPVRYCSQVSSSRIGCRLGLCLVAFMVHDFFSTLSLDRYTVRAAYFNATGSHVVKKESRGEKKGRNVGMGKEGPNEAENSRDERL